MEDIASSMLGALSTVKKTTTQIGASTLFSFGVSVSEDFTFLEEGRQCFEASGE